MGGQQDQSFRRRNLWRGQKLHSSDMEAGPFHLGPERGEVVQRQDHDEQHHRRQGEPELGGDLRPRAGRQHRLRHELLSLPL